MNFFPHIPMLSTVFSSIGCYLLPFGVVLLWLLYESRKVKAILLAGLVILTGEAFIRRIPQAVGACRTPSAARVCGAAVTGCIDGIYGIGCAGRENTRGRARGGAISACP